MCKPGHSVLSFLLSYQIHKTMDKQGRKGLEKQTVSALASVRQVKLGSKCGTKSLLPALSEVKDRYPSVMDAKIPACSLFSLQRLLKCSTSYFSRWTPGARKTRRKKLTGPLEQMLHEGRDLCFVFQAPMLVLGVE